MTVSTDAGAAKRLTHLLAAVAMVAILGGVLALQRFSKLEAETQGPSVIATDAAGAVLLGGRDRLWWVSADEKSVREFALADFGLSGPIMAVAHDGQDWYIGDDGTGNIHRCDLEAKRCTAVLKGEGRILRRTHKIAFAPDRIFVTDTERHELKVFDAAGSLVQSTRGEGVALCFPNGVRVLGDQLLIADTNNRRIAAIALDGTWTVTTHANTHAGPAVTQPNCTAASTALGDGGDAAINTTLDSANIMQIGFPLPGVRLGRTVPSAVQPASDGRLWAVLASDGMRDGDLVVFDAEGEFERVVSLAPDQDPTELVEQAGRLLVTDPTRMTVYDVLANGAAAAEWSVPGLRKLLQARRDERALWTRLHQFSLFSIFIGLGVAGLVVVRERKREAAEAAGFHQELEEAPDKALARSAAVQHGRVSFTEGMQGLEVVFRWVPERKWPIILLVAIGLLGSVPILIAMTFLLATGESGAFTAGSVAQVGLFGYFATMGIARLRNRTTLTVDASTLRVRTGPVPLLKPLQLPVAQVKGLRVVAPWAMLGRDSNLHRLVAQTRDGKETLLVGGMTWEVAHLIGAKLAQRLHFKNRNA